MEKIVEMERARQEDLREDLRSLFQGAIRLTLEMVLEEELKAMVGARRFEPVGSSNAFIVPTIWTPLRPGPRARRGRRRRPARDQGA